MSNLPLRAYVLIVILFASATSVAQNSSSIADSTNALLRLNSSYQRSHLATDLSALNVLAKFRQRLIAEALEANTSEVVADALPDDIRESLPASVRGSVEQHLEIDGVLEVRIEDSDHGSKVRYGLRTANARFNLHFSRQPQQELLTGSEVHVRGVLVGSTELALDPTGTSGSTSSLTTISAPLPNTSGAQNTLVILVNFQDLATQPYTVSSAYDVVFNQTSAFDLENSFGQMWLTGDVAGWFTVPVLSTTCDNNAIATYADQAATAAGINLANYSHKVYAFPNINACSWWGLGTVGGTPSQAWINGSFALKVVAHEMGHNFGLYHSHAWNCGSTTLGSSCTSVEYGDTLDDMGNPSAGHFSAFQKQRLGWLASGISPSITTVQSNGNYVVNPYEVQDSSVKALRVLRSTDPTTGKNTWYYIEYRQATGVDSFLSTNPNVTSGVVVHTATDDDGNSNYLLNMAPALGTFGKPALDVGQSFVDPAAGLTIQTVSASGPSATVNVIFGTPACSHFNPTILMTPTQSPTVQAGTDVQYTVSVTNNDNAGCSSSAFNLNSTVPSGWIAQFGNAMPTLVPGASTSTTLDVTSASSATSAIYPVSVTASNSSATAFSATASATYVLNTTPCVHTNPTVTLSPSSSQSVQAGTTVSYVIGVFNNDNASCNSSTFTLSDSIPTGWAAKFGVSSSSLTIAPGKQGSTSLSITSPVNATSGTYTFQGSATNSGAVGFSGAAAASYIVAGGSCTRANPTMTISPAQSAVLAGTTVAYAVSVTNNDAAACSASTYNLSGSIPSGWTGVFDNQSLSPAPGASAQTYFRVTSPTNAAGGGYPVTVQATSATASTFAASASATYLVSSASQLNLALSTDASSYARGQVVTMSAAVSQGGQAVTGAVVVFNLKKADGSMQSFSATTTSSGVAVIKYRTRSKDPRGTYYVNASTSISGVSASASVSFSVM